MLVDLLSSAARHFFIHLVYLFLCLVVRPRSTCRTSPQVWLFVSAALLFLPRSVCRPMLSLLFTSCFSSSLPVDASGPKHFQHSLTRGKYEAMVEELVQKTLPPCERCLRDSGLSKKDIQVRSAKDASIRFVRLSLHLP